MSLRGRLKPSESQEVFQSGSPRSPPLNRSRARIRKLTEGVWSPAGILFSLLVLLVFLGAYSNVITFVQLISHPGRAMHLLFRIRGIDPGTLPERKQVEDISLRDSFEVRRNVQEDKIELPLSPEGALPSPSQEDRSPEPQDQTTSCVPEMELERQDALLADKGAGCSAPKQGACKVGVFPGSLWMKNPPPLLERAMTSFALGVQCAGDTAFVSRQLTALPCDVAVVFGQAPPSGHPTERFRRALDIQQQMAGRLTLYLDLPLLRRSLPRPEDQGGGDGVGGPSEEEEAREEYIRLGLNSSSFTRALYPHPQASKQDLKALDLGHRSRDFIRLNHTSRWLQVARTLNTPLQEYRKEGRHILVVLQREQHGETLHLDWVRQVISDIRHRSSRPVLVRPDPTTPRRHLATLVASLAEAGYPGVKVEGAATVVPQKEQQKDQQVGGKEGTAAAAAAGTATTVPKKPRSLQALLKNCWAVVTHSSVAGVSALVAGVPVVATDSSSPVWHSSDHTARHIDNITLHTRGPLLEHLALSQWTIQEILGEVPWVLLRTRLRHLGICGSCADTPANQQQYHLGSQPDNTEVAIQTVPVSSAPLPLSTQKTHEEAGPANASASRESKTEKDGAQYPSSPPPPVPDPPEPKLEGMDAEIVKLLTETVDETAGEKDSVRREDAGHEGKSGAKPSISSSGHSGAAGPKSTSKSKSGHKLSTTLSGNGVSIWKITSRIMKGAGQQDEKFSSKTAVHKDVMKPYSSSNSSSNLVQSCIGAGCNRVSRGNWSVEVRMAEEEEVETPPSPPDEGTEGDTSGAPLTWGSMKDLLLNANKADEFVHSHADDEGENEDGREQRSQPKEDSRHQSKKKVLLFSAVDKHEWDKVKLHISTHRCYARQHGYDYALEKLDRLERVQMAFRKVELALAHLHFYDTVVWLSPDVAMLGKESIESIVRYLSAVHQQDCNMLFQDISALTEAAKTPYRSFQVNSGFFVLQNHSSTRQMLHRWLGYRGSPFSAVWALDEGPLVTVISDALLQANGSASCLPSDECLKIAKKMPDIGKRAGAVCARIKISRCGGEVSPRSFPNVCLADVQDPRERYCARNHYKKGDLAWQMVSRPLTMHTVNLTCGVNKHKVEKIMQSPPPPIKASVERHAGSANWWSQIGDSKPSSNLDSVSHQNIGQTEHQHGGHLHAGTHEVGASSKSASVHHHIKQ